MSTNYNLEPPTRGQITLHTSHGRVTIALWSRESPQTCRSIIQHALNSYYTNLPFHRVIPSLLAQTGDPTRTGTGGRAATPTGLITKETNPRLCFRRRGLCALVADEQGHARSQFFLTLSPARWLDGAHSIFGSVVGDTIFNVLALAAHPVDAFDDPAVMLKGVSVESNPFPDIVALPAPESAQETTNIAAARSHPVSAKRAVKSRGRLSFAESDSEGEENHGALFRPPKSTRQVSLRPPAVPHAEATSSGGDKHGKECPNKLGERTVKQGLNNSANIIREAEAEFERLKARHVVATRHSHNNNNNNNAHKAEERDQVKKEQQEEGNVEAQTGVISKKRLGDRSRKATSRRDEGETLRRLRAFEGRIVRARRDARTANAKPGKSVEHGVSPQNHWFATRLRLVTDAMVEEDDYEVRFGTKKT